jgi:hypothetical protein
LTIKQEKLNKLKKNKRMLTMYKNNSGLIAITKVNKHKKGLCLTEKLVRENPLLLIHVAVTTHSSKTF